MELVTVQGQASKQLTWLLKNRWRLALGSKRSVPATKQKIVHFSLFMLEEFR
jgi:hypothetical protein